MLEVGRFYAAIVECHATAATLDALAVPPRVHACRVAPEELLLLAPPNLADDLLRRAKSHLAVVEPAALAVDQSDGWTIFGLPGELPGDEGMLALRQLAMMPLPQRRPAFVQGAVAGGAAKLLLLPGIVFVLVPFPLRDHVERRLREVGGGALRIAAAEVPFAGLAAEG